MKQFDWKTISKWMIVTAAGVAISGLLLCMSLSAVVSHEILSMDMAKKIAIVLITVLLIFGCTLPAAKIPKSKLPICVGTAAIFFLICLIGKLILFPERTIVISWHMLFPFCAAIVAGVLSSKRKVYRR